MKTDAQIQKDVMDQLKWEPSLTASQIGVAVKNGIVTLSGQVDSYLKKLDAEKTALKVGGVKAVAEDMQIGVSPSFRKTDPDIAEAVMNALKWHSAVQQEKVKVKVEDGIVRLEGEVDWDFQRTAAADAVKPLTGVRMVINLITLKPKAVADRVKDKISASFQRHASLDANEIEVDVYGNKVVLTGTVRSIAERQDAVNAAWGASGVTAVEDRLEVRVPAYDYEEL